MRQITVDCRGFTPRTGLHKVLADALSFPDRYGRTLDALHDMLTDIRQDTLLDLTNLDRSAPENRGLLLVLADAQRENPHLKVLFDGEP